jgi:uncharacterized protein YbjT (DUF2867 family)
MTTEHDLVLVTGAGGVGRLVVERLRTQDVPVRVLVRRDDDRAAAVRALGAEVVTGDLPRPDTVAGALDGVRRAYFVAGSAFLAVRRGPDTHAVGGSDA